MAGEPVTSLMVTTDITVGGMTCAACVRRVEKKLAKLDGVTATVNLATGLARVSHPEYVPAEDLVAAVEQAGYRAALPAPPAREEEGVAHADTSDAAARQECERLLVTALLAVPVLVLSMVPALQFRNWQWLCFALAAPVAVWSAWPFHARAVRGLRHSMATMDTLVSLGVVASFSWSAYALFLGGAGDPGMRMPFSLLPSASDGTAHAALAALVPLAACAVALAGPTAWTSTGKAGTPARIRVTDGRLVLPSTGAAETSAYFRVANEGGSADCLIRVASPGAPGGIALSRHRMTEGDAAYDTTIDSVGIAAGDSLAMSLSGVGLTVSAASGQWRSGDLVPVTFEFRRSGRVTVPAVVVRPDSVSLQ
ncbi:cation transporter [Streptomyces sp. cg40]|uniref:copper chaperone PCu(A)C n=1 Tax=Streptomyces sp. cg40 TaxID=3419764 RepID=UPI003D05AFCC